MLSDRLKTAQDRARHRQRRGRRPARESPAASPGSSFPAQRALPDRPAADVSTSIPAGRSLFKRRRRERISTGPLANWTLQLHPAVTDGRHDRFQPALHAEFAYEEPDVLANGL